MSSLAFTNKVLGSTADPDFAYIHEKVQAAITAPVKASPTVAPGTERRRRHDEARAVGQPDRGAGRRGREPQGRLRTGRLTGSPSGTAKARSLAGPGPRRAGGVQRGCNAAIISARSFIRDGISPTPTTPTRSPPRW